MRTGCELQRQPDGQTGGSFCHLPGGEEWAEAEPAEVEEKHMTNRQDRTTLLALICVAEATMWTNGCKWDLNCARMEKLTSLPQDSNTSTGGDSSTKHVSAENLMGNICPRIAMLVTIARSCVVHCMQNKHGMCFHTSVCHVQNNLLSFVISFCRLCCLGFILKSFSPHVSGNLPTLPIVNLDLFWYFGIGYDLLGSEPDQRCQSHNGACEILVFENRFHSICFQAFRSAVLGLQWTVT